MFQSGIRFRGPAMARDVGLEERVREALGPLPGLAERRMFGGVCLLLDGHMLCAASDRGLMARLGPGRDAWAVEEGVPRMVMNGRAMPGWVRADPDRLGDDALLHRLVDAALAFTRTLPPKG